MSAQAESKMMMSDCEVKAGAGDIASAPIVVVYEEPREILFPEGEYMLKLCKALHIDAEDLYVTPFYKDSKEHRKTPLEYIDLLIEELTFAESLKTIWILGSNTLDAMGFGDVPNYFRWVYGMYMPMFVEGMYGLLIPGEQEGRTMPDKVKKRLMDRLEDACSCLQKEGWVEPPDELRADMAMFAKMEDDLGFKEDRSLSEDASYKVLWSPVVRDHIIICTTHFAKQQWLKMGFGIVFTAKEIQGLSEKDADFVAQSIKALRARSAHRKGNTQ